MDKRLKIGHIDPDFYKMLSDIDTHIAGSGPTVSQLDLLKIRASQLNGCAYCIQSHTKDARAHGEAEKRIYALDAWEESPYFSDEERALLALTEEVTLIREKRVSDDTYQQAIALFGEQLTAQLIMAIISINAWNRIGITTRMTPI
ncbi:carboxymuconolactone decarboxylase family protein [Spirosoma endbachense]|uniref:Carboxymuconolactone decarboxylase family protein n=1 Tax=Spirosoma endbachense TaxID=2666025 RepID=A0A6P1W4X9_9BACT|nr:carboxymuconolactone decarboxylase family protein [Spirosoma endbachense]QHV99392.1 carboxymuconolactone decarboxylase family protein [Spirosoma endbachense]